MPLLQDLTNHVSHIKDFGELPIPFRAVATDIVTGNMVVLTQGDLARAMRASMAVPSIFSPVNSGALMLVDGGLTNNLPVDIAKEMGAEIIIAVDISSPYLSRQQLTNLLQVTNQMTNILTGVNTEQRRQMITPEDVFIEPKLGDMSAGDFHRVAEAIPIGEVGAQAHLDKLLALSLSEFEYQSHLSSRPDVKSTLQI